MAATFSAAIRKLLVGRPFGDLFPPRPPPPGQTQDGRTVALETLKEYITELTFVRQGATGGPPIPFRIEPENFHIEWPDGEADLVSPSIAVLPGPADYDAIGLNAYVEEDSLGKYGRNTLVQWQCEAIEKIKLEIHAAKIPERRAILAGLETAFMPTELRAGIRFLMPGYFNQLCTFILEGREIPDDRNSALNRRKALLTLDFRYTVVALVNATTMRPMMKVDTDIDLDTGELVDLTDP